MTETSPAALALMKETAEAGAFSPTWESLSANRHPDWFRDAKFGIWAHWGPQCEPEFGDWYGRRMYQQGQTAYEHHVKTYGHPTEFGFKDVIHRWQAANWNPGELVAFYKRAGAKYFFAMANHHDNLDLWDSRHHAWNSTRVGPKKDLLAGWAAAAKANGLPLGLSVHAAHAPMWFATCRDADKTGPLAGMKYDGRLTAADGKGQWWEGFDPAAIYAQDGTPGKSSALGHPIWEWDRGAGAPIPSDAFSASFHDRTIDLINQFDPELLYFDDTILPLWPVNDVGLRLVAHYYNRLARVKGRQGLVFGRGLSETQRQALTWSVERGAPDSMQPLPWQTDTCLGDWHYNRGIYNAKRYKSAKLIVQTLSDIVSKNGNLLLSVPVRGDGTIDELERGIVEHIGLWLAANGEAIYGTRPWKIFGEGPTASEEKPLKLAGFNEGKGAPHTQEDLRFTAKGDDVFVIVLDRPTKLIVVKAMGVGGKLERAIAAVEVLGSSEPVKWEQTGIGLTIQPPANVPAEDVAVMRGASGLRLSPGAVCMSCPLHLGRTVLGVIVVVTSHVSAEATAPTTAPATAPRGEVVAEVLGQAVYGDDLKDDQHKTKLFAAVCTPLAESYSHSRIDRIRATDAEIGTFIRFMKREAPAQGLSLDYDNPQGLELARSFIERFKSERLLYEEFGRGRVMFQQAGYEAFDATHRWLLAEEQAGRLKFYDAAIRQRFFDYWEKPPRIFLSDDPPDAEFLHHLMTPWWEGPGLTTRAKQ